MATCEERLGLSNARVTHVTRQNSEGGFSLLDQLISECVQGSFFSVDTEFSGFSNDPRLHDSDLTIRYGAIKSLVNSRALFSLGISCFIPVSQKLSTYRVTILDFLLRCESSWECTSAAGEFLVFHRFDFNSMFVDGIPYTRASTELDKILTSHKKRGNRGECAMPFRWGPLPSGLLWRMGRSAVPLVVHNGLLDLALLYAAFHGKLHETLNGFIAQLLDCAPAGYFDTKVLAAAYANTQQSFLSFLFAKAVLHGGVSVLNNDNADAVLLSQNRMVKRAEEVALSETETLCPLFALRGFCPRGVQCFYSHDPFLAVQQVEKGLVPGDLRAAHKKYRLQSKLHKRKMKTALKLNKKAKTKLLAAHLTNSTTPIQDTLNASSVSGADNKHETKEDVDLDDTPSGLCSNCRHCPMCKEKALKVTKRGHTPKERLPKAGGETSQTNSNTPFIYLNATAVKQSDNMERPHSAGWDAFCTGYIFAHFRDIVDPQSFTKLRNRLYLQNKPNTLLLCKSHFKDCSAVEEEQSTNRVPEQ